MAIDQTPIVSQWYQHLEKGDLFQVIAVEEDSGTIEILHIDGDIEGLNDEDWSDMKLEAIDPPEDWSESLDSMDLDELMTYDNTAQQDLEGLIGQHADDSDKER